MHRIKALPAFVFDVNGVLRLGPNPLKGAKEAIELLQSYKPHIPFIILSNSGGATEASRAKELSNKLNLSNNFEIRPSQMVLCHSPLKNLVSEYKDKLVLIAGGRRCIEVAKMYGYMNIIGVEEYAALNPKLVSFSSYQ